MEDKKNLRVIQKKLRGGIQRNVMYSDDLKLGFLEQITVTDEDIQEIYKSQYANQYFSGEKSDIAKNFNNFLPLQERRINKIKRLIRPEDSLLEIGSGPGYFLQAISKYCNNAEGLELNAAEVEFAKSLNLKAKCGTITDINSDIKFNHICLFQVLEHQPDPIDFLRKVSGNLESQRGFIHLELPTLNNPLISLYDIPEFKDFWFQEPHLYYFTSESIKWLAKESGLNIIQNDIDQSAGLINHINWLLTRKPMSNRGVVERPSPSFKINTEIFNNNSAECENKINSFFKKMNIEYLKLLKDMGFGDVLSITLSKV